MTKIVEKSNYLIFSFVAIVVGLLAIFGNVFLFRNLVFLILFLMILVTFKDLLSVIFTQGKQKEQHMTVASAFVNFLFVLLLFFFRDYSLAIVPMVFASYLIFNGCVKFCSFVLLCLNRIKGRSRTLFISLVLLGLGITFLFAPLFHLREMLYLLGAYSILLGITYLWDFLDLVFPYRRRWFLKRFRVTLPVFIDAFLPLRKMKEIDSLTEQKKLPVLTLKRDEDPPDLEIFIHVAGDGNGRFGHADFYFEGEVISYGAYDKDERIFHDGIGRGTLFFTERNRYLNFCIDYSKKTLFAFGLRLTEEQKQIVRDRIIEIKENIEEEPWIPPVVEAQRRGENLDSYQDYASMLYKATHMKIYKFKSGKYKTFFILGTNCVSLLNSIVGKSGLDIFKMYGILTPGAYYDYLNNEFQKENSIVISKTIYNRFHRPGKENFMLLIEYPKCSTCRNAKKWLEEHDLAFLDRHIVEETPSAEELAAWQERSGYPLKKFFNTSGNLYKEWKLKDRLDQMSREEQLDLLSQNGMLLKRPMLVLEDRILLGFHENEWEQLLSSSIDND